MMNLKTIWQKDRLIVLLIMIGLIAPLGYILQIKALRGLGAAWMVSPLPIVFSDVNGYEAFGSTYSLKVLSLDEKNRPQDEEFPITFRKVGLLAGPYNRKNVFGAVIGYAPRMPWPIAESVLKYGLCGGGVLTKEFQLPHNIVKAELNIQDGTIGREDKQYRYIVECGLSK